jgi:hypothetical protein
MDGSCQGVEFQAALQEHGHEENFTQPAAPPLVLAVPQL